MSLVEIDSATLRYGALTALSGLDLRLEPGEVLGLLGHNGAGKTTTIKLVLGLLAPAKAACGSSATMRGAWRRAASSATCRRT